MSKIDTLKEAIKDIKDHGYPEQIEILNKLNIQQLTTPKIKEGIYLFYFNILKVSIFIDNLKDSKNIIKKYDSKLSYKKVVIYYTMGSYYDFLPETLHILNKNPYLATIEFNWENFEDFLANELSTESNIKSHKKLDMINI